ncbi:tRNA (guanosine(37)-N1)-methyltransferase TrmD [bacterium]|nr:tRNA (guanosine(37)-N1)-methyltransferase TrmD [bacterium]
MNFHVLTVLPELVEGYFKGSILGRAAEKGIINITTHALRAYATDKHKSVDDRVYGGGAGMVFKADVVVNAVRDIKNKFSIDRVIFLSPRGRVFKQAVAGELKEKYHNILFICGRYEGLDERAITLTVDEEISIGDYVVTGGELAAMVVVDAVSRLIPGVIGDEEGPVNESHMNGLLEHPHYTRPEDFEGHKVPSVLLSGNHAQIEAWRKEESLRVTREKRPDLLNKKA